MPFVKNNPAAAPTVRMDIATARVRLRDADPALRRAAARALGADPAAVPALLAALDVEADRPVRSALLGALAAIGSEDAVTGLAGCLRSDDAWLRNAAIDQLRGMPAQVAPVLAHLLVDWDGDVRILAVSIIDSLRHPLVEEWLLQLIATDDDVNVCGAALDVLAEVATLAAAGPVGNLIARFAGEPYIEFAGRLVLSRLAGS
jgi:HEAT repeat protein